jgi:hypothetical protein
MEIRDRDKTLESLKTMFDDACQIGRMGEVRKAKTQKGLKNTFMDFFIEKISSLSSTMRGSYAQKQQAINEMRNKFGSRYPVSPIWHIKCACFTTKLLSLDYFSYAA